MEEKKVAFKRRPLSLILMVLACGFVIFFGFSQLSIGNVVGGLFILIGLFCLIGAVVMILRWFIPAIRYDQMQVEFQNFYLWETKSLKRKIKIKWQWVSRVEMMDVEGRETKGDVFYFYLTLQAQKMQALNKDGRIRVSIPELNEKERNEFLNVMINKKLMKKKGV